MYKRIDDGANDGLVLRIRRESTWKRPMFSQNYGQCMTEFLMMSPELQICLTDGTGDSAQLWPNIIKTLMIS